MVRVLNRSLFAAAIALAGLWGTAHGAQIHSGNVDLMGHWYGRAGGPAPSDVVSDKAAQAARQSVSVSFSQAVADWTNMPRSEAQVGPVTDSFGAANQKAPEVYGRAGDAQVLEQMQSPSNRG